MWQVFPGEIEEMVAVISARNELEHRVRLLEMSEAACVPNMKPKDREAFFNSLARNTQEKQNISVDELKKTNEFAKTFFKSKGL